MNRYVVTLTPEERQSLLDLVSAGTGTAQKLAHARILLLKADADLDAPARSDEAIAEAVKVSIATVKRVRQRFVEQGLEAALVRKPQGRPSRPRKLGGRAEAHLIKLACSKPPEGRDKWTFQLLADKLVELKVVDFISDETVRRALQKSS